MTNAQTWIAIAKDCDEAAKSNRAIDVLIFCALKGIKKVEIDHDSAGPRYYPRHFDGSGGEELEPRVFEGFTPTTSLDTIIPLIEAEFPGSGILTGKGKTRENEPLFGTIIYDRLGQEGQVPIGSGESNSWPLSCCSAFCRAMAAREIDSESGTGRSG